MLLPGADLHWRRGDDLMADTYVPLLDLLREVQERWSLNTKTAQDRIRDAHILGDLVLEIRHPDGWVTDLDRHQAWNVATWRRLFDEGIIDAEWPVPRSRRTTWERCRIFGIRQNLDSFLGAPASPPATPVAEPPIAEPVPAAHEPVAAEGPTKRRGPKPGANDRFGDHALFPQLIRLMKKGHLSDRQAALQLAKAGKVAGTGSIDSRARRLAERYRNRPKN
jgi:hypothetical protein